MNTMVYAGGSFVNGAISGTIAMAIVVATFAIIAVTASCFMAKQTGVASALIKGSIVYLPVGAIAGGIMATTNAPAMATLIVLIVLFFAINLIGNTIYERKH